MHRSYKARPSVEVLESRRMLHHCSISFSSATYSASEGAGSAIIVINRDFAAGDISFDFHALPGTAGDADFTRNDGETIFWGESESNIKIITVNLTQDSLVEGDETVQLSIDNLQFTSSGEFTSAVLTIVDDDSSSNAAPTIGSFGGAKTYVENAAALQIAPAPNATVTDADSTNFDTGKLTVKYTVGGGSGDRLAIQSAAGITTNASNQVLFNGTAFGSFTGGVGTTPLVVTFNAQATPAKAATLLKNIVYSNVSDNPAAKRTVTATISDGDGGTSAAVSKVMNVTRVNDVPVLGISGSIGYVRNDPAVVLASGATVTDPDSANFSGGFLRVRITAGGGANNTLAIGSGFTVDGSGNVLQGSTIIGTRVSNGVGTSELRINFNSNATRSVVQALVRSITYRNVNGSAGQRKVEFTVNDGDGGTSLPKVKTVNVS
jgi:hypothetical protein